MWLLQHTACPQQDPQQQPHLPPPAQHNNNNQQIVLIFMQVNNTQFIRQVRGSNPGLVQIWSSYKHNFLKVQQKRVTIHEALKLTGNDIEKGKKVSWKELS